MSTLQEEAVPESAGAAAKRRRWPWFVVPVALLAGVGLGGMSTEPEVVTETKTVTETVTDEVEVTPQSCFDALAAADRGFDLARQGFDASAKTMDAASRFDIAGIDAQTRRMNALAPRLGTAIDDYGAARTLCRGW